MAYQIRKSEKITEEIKLGDDITINVEVNPSKIASSIIQGYNNVIRAQLALKKAGKIKKFAETPEQAEALEGVGVAYIEVMTVVFGEDNTQTFIDYFDGDWVELMESVLPFITDRVIPECKKFAEEKRKKAAEEYKYSGNQLR